MKVLFLLFLLSASTSLFAVCEEALLNADDIIREGYSCSPISISGAKKMNKLCLIRAETTLNNEENFKYTHIRAIVISHNDKSSEYSTFKWHHKENTSISKMIETKRYIKMKDVTAADFLSSNIYKISIFSKVKRELSIRVYKKKTFLGIKKRAQYSGEFTCQRFK